MIDELREYVPNVHFELIPIRDLVSNQEYQRNLSWGHVKKAVENFDLNQINPIKVSRRDGVNYVFNGQHTAEIVAAVSGSRDTPVWCMIYDDLDYEQEADIFANQMKNVKPLSPYDVFNGHCQAGNDKELMIKGLVESYNLKIAPTAAPDHICAVGALETIYDKYGYDMLQRVINLIIITWEGEQKSFSANIMNGLARFLYAYGDKVNEAMFKEKLGVISIKELTKTAKERKAGSLGFAEAMMLFYNKRLKNPLSLNALYDNRFASKKTKKKEADNNEEAGSLVNVNEE
jgi:hypothetical protein